MKEKSPAGLKKIVRSAVSQLVPPAHRHGVRTAGLATALRFRRVRRSILSPDGEAPEAPGTLIADRAAHLFCGYYDVTPLRGETLLVTRTAAPNRPLVEPLPGEVGVVNIAEGGRSFQSFSTTDTWSWQQGCRLQWLRRGSGSLAIFNTRVDGEAGSAILDVANGTVIGRFPFPVYAVAPHGDSALHLNFARLHSLRPGYGYAGLCDPWHDEKLPDDDGVWVADLQEGRSRLLVSTAEIAALEPHATMHGAVHYLNHLEYNPDGTRFLVLHLWVKQGRRFSRLITFDTDGSAPAVLNNEGLASHYTWRSNDEILHFARHADSGTGYHLYHDPSGERTRVASGVLDVDGHPSFLPGGNRFITDTYPDAYGDQRLLEFDLTKGNARALGRYYSPAAWRGEVRCDLHPRLSMDASAIIVDTVNRGLRAPRILALSRDMANGESANAA